jgi:tetratricopeptide (TPR) repeat protein
VRGFARSYRLNSNMTPELWQRLKPLFHAALEEDTQNRAAFIDAACGRDLELKKQLVQLLEAEQQDTGSLDAPLAHLNGFMDNTGARFQSNELVLGRFRIIRPVGKGGMGEVYEAEDLQLGVVALKTIRHGIASSSDAFERFRQEVQLARRVSGPEVCRIHELYLLPASGKHEATAFLTMEYLDGITLYEKILRDGPLPWKEALNIALEICEGLRLIHEKGIIHRDLKTGNIMLCQQAGATRVVLMDFGLARDFSEDALKKESASTTDRPAKTRPQMIMGTPEYMAPEQFEAKPVSPATDIYALGIILYELVTGLHPYAADTPVAAAIRRGRLPPPPSSLRARIPGQCDRVIARCLEYDPEKRFQSAKEVAKALRAGPANIENLKKDRPWVLWFASAIVLGLFAGSAFFFWQSRQYYRPNPEALRWYNAGVAALREGNNVKATRSLQEAVAQDNHFVMAHARLAEAWANLDFDGNAQRELLLATPGGRHLQPLDRMYLDAIHATVTKDFPTEIAIYRKILGRLPPAQKPSGYVDLGMAYEHVGDPSQALENYTRASTLDSDNAASYMHVAQLQNHQNHVAEADRAFQHAQLIFTTEMNQEGLAELDYARGAAAGDRRNFTEANQFLEHSLDEAKKIPSVQLQIRALNQLSTVAYKSDANPRAKEYAEQAIRLARENRLDSWAADGLVRLANSQIHQGQFQDAEDSLDEALQLARQTQQPRVEALANLTLASLMNQRGLPDEVIAPAHAALAFFKQNGYFVSAAGASLLLIRTERDKGRYQQALQSGDEFLDLATRSGVHDLMRQAEEVIGTVFQAMEHYPDALLHFQNARSLADTESTKALEAVNCAEILWRLGRYDEAETTLRFASVNDRLATIVGVAHAGALLSNQKYNEALSTTQKILLRYPKMASDDRQELELDRTLAKAHLGIKQDALKDLSHIEEQAKTDDLVARSKVTLVTAEVTFLEGLAQQAHDTAALSTTHFSATGQLDSELRSACLAASASKLLRNQKDYETFSAKAIDIVSQIQQTWSPQVSQKYFSRPDLQMLMREVPVTVLSGGR